MSKLRIFLLLAIFLPMHINVDAQISREHAIDSIKNHVLSDELNHLDLYLSIAVKAGQNGLLLAYNQTIPYPYDSNWIFFVDDVPYANWHHSCRYIFMNSETGEYTIVSYKTFFLKAGKMSLKEFLLCKDQHHPSFNGLILQTIRYQD
jgi:hypothetical protein